MTQPEPRHAPPLVIGLTGGIGSGKSTVAGLFADLGVPVIDADAIARELVAPGQPALAEIREAFGAGVINQDGRLDRDRLRRIVFADPDRRRRLEAILHPRIVHEIRRRIRLLRGGYCIVSIPLLVEAGLTGLVDRILVVDCPETLQRRRIARRDRLPAAEIDAVLQAQAGREARLRVADDVILNDRDLATLRTAVETLHRKYTALAAKSGR